MRQAKSDFKSFTPNPYALSDGGGIIVTLIIDISIIIYCISFLRLP